MEEGRIRKTTGAEPKENLKGTLGPQASPIFFCPNPEAATSSNGGGTLRKKKFPPVSFSLTTISNYPSVEMLSVGADFIKMFLIMLILAIFFQETLCPSKLRCFDVFFTKSYETLGCISANKLCAKVVVFAASSRRSIGQCFVRLLLPLLRRQTGAAAAAAAGKFDPVATWKEEEQFSSHKEGKN